jgi:hypothetical protein
MTSETGADPIRWTLALKETGGKLTATFVVAPDNNEMPAKDFLFADGVIKFKVTHGNSGATTGTKN